MFSLQKRWLVFYDIIHVIIYEVIYFTLAFFYPHYELNQQAIIVCRLEYKNTYKSFDQATFFSSTQLHCFLTFYQFSVSLCVCIGKIVYLSF